MAETALAQRPTRRDEDWRYADEQWLAKADPAALSHWREETVHAGETRTECLELQSGVTRLRVAIEEGASFALFALNRAQDYARLEIEARLSRGAHFEFGGVTIGGDIEGAPVTREFVIRTIHEEPQASSNQTVRAVHWGRSTGNFLGRIEVARGAQKTDAAQNYRALLLEKGASANAKPELEIYADDVKCAHGAAIGALDRDAAFYMAARGIPPQVARRLLVQAFIGDAFVALNDETRREALFDAALECLEGAQL